MSWEGYRLAFVDRLMNRPLAGLAAGIIAAASGVALWLLYGPSPLKLLSDFKAFRAWILLAGSSALILAVGGWWTVFTWRRIWRRGRSERERILYDYGVRGFGVFGSVGILFLTTWLGWTVDAAESRGLFGPLMTGGLLLGVFVGVPLSLQMGYFWGVLFAALVGPASDRRTDRGEPPRVT